MGSIVCNCTSIGAFGKLLLEKTGTAPRTFTSASSRLEILYETLATKRNLQHTEAITGTTSRLISGVRAKSYLTQGVIALQASPANLALVLPLILGGTPSGNSFPLGSVLPTFDVLVYRESGIFQYSNLRVAQAVLRGKTSNGGESSDFMELLLVCVGEQEIITETGGVSPWPASEPSLPTTARYVPYAFYESTFELNNTEIAIEDIKLTIDNQLAIKFYNERYPTCIRSTGRKIMMEASSPFTCEALQESLDLNTVTGTAEISFATPTTSPVFQTSFAIPYARTEFETPTIRNKADLPIKISVEGYATSGNDEMITTNDSTA